MSLIPKLLHQIWIGDGEASPPERQLAYIESVQKMHPGWEYKLWTRQSILSEFDARELFERAHNHAQRSDIARYLILYKYGGLYLDTDIEVTQSLEPLLEGRNAFGASEDGRYIAIAVLAAKPRMALYKDLVNNLPSQMGCLPTNIETGPVYFTKTLFLSGCDDFSILSPETFYPPNIKDAGYGRYHITETTFTVHHYAGSWIKNVSLGRRVYHKFNSMLLKIKVI